MIVRNLVGRNLPRVGRRGARLLLRGASWTAGIATVACLSAAVGAGRPARAADAFGIVVLNEVQYHPADDLRDNEFVELHNGGANDVDVGGWVLSGGVTFTIPRPTVIPAGEFLVIAADPQALEGTYGLEPGSALGPYEGSLSNDGERLELWTAGRYLASYVEYSDSAPWPETPDGLGPTLERISPLREDGDAEAWAASIAVGGTPGAPNTVRVGDPAPPSSSTVFVAAGTTWRYLKGTAEPPAAWATSAFDDAAWSSGPSGFGYDDADDATVLADMRYGYTSLYIRRTFQLADPARVESLVLGMLIDDGYVAYLNGTEIDRFNVPGSAGAPLAYDARATDTLEPAVQREVDVSWARSLLVAGQNVLAVHGVNATIDNRDFSLRPSLSGQAAGGSDTPATFVAVGEADWRFLRGTAAPPAGWRDLSYVDDAWETGAAGFGYGDGDDATQLDDMEGNYLTVFVRKRFRVTDVSKVTSLVLDVSYDDGFIAYLNGSEVARSNVQEAGYDRPATDPHEAAGFESFAIAAPQAVLRSGINVLAIEGHNDDLSSSDLSLNPSLRGTLLSDDVEDPPDPPPPRPPRDVVINEILQDAGGNGWVELYNASSEPVEVGGFSLHVFPRAAGNRTLDAGTTIGAGERLVLSEAELGFPLSSAVVLVLSTPEGYYKDAINPRTAPLGLSTGRWPDGFDDRWVFVTPTRNAPNLVRPESRVVIHEIQFHPADQNAGGEFIELYNRSATDAVDLSGWSFTRGIDYAFPAGTSIGPGGYLVLARDPTAAASSYGIPRPLGPWTGGLRNDAETLLLRDALKNPVDRVRYADEGSWPEGADGQGPSVELVNPEIENRWGPAWAASTGHGTPGAANSRFQADPPPIVVGVEHSPVVPAPTDPVRVTATISDERAVTSATLFWRTDAVDQVSQATMVDDGLGDDGIASNGVYGATIPPAAAQTILVFWIQAGAQGGQTRTVPAGAPRPAFLYQVESPAPEPARPIYRIVMRAADLNTLRTRGNNSDVPLDCTFVSAGKAYYNRGVNYRGQSARSCNPLSYRVHFDHDVDLDGIKRLNLNGCNTHRQWSGLDFLRRTSIPAPECWFRKLSLNGQTTAQYHLRVEAIDEQFLERALPGDDTGNLYRGISGADLDYRGESFSSYRSDYEKHSNEEAADWSDVVDLSRRFDASTTSAADFPAAIEEAVDVEEWAAYFAVYAMLATTENSILLDNGDDYFLYHRPSDGRWILLPWDLDSVFDEETQVLFRPTVDQIERFLEHPRYAPLYWCRLEELLGSSFVEEVLDARIAHLEPLFNPSVVADLRQFVTARRNYVLPRVRSSLAATTASRGRICGSSILVAPGALRLEGVAPGCGTTSVRVGGAPGAYNPQTSVWTADLTVDGAGTVRVESLDSAGLLVAALDLSIEPAATQSTLPASISGSLTLTPQGSPYRVSGTSTVAQGSTLTVEAGTKVVFDGGARLVVEGRLSTVGSETQPVLLGIDACTTGAEGLVFRPTATGSSLLHTRISGLRRAGTSSAGILVDGSRVTLESVEVSGASGAEAIAVQSGGTLTLDASLVRDAGDGIVARASTVTVRGSRVANVAGAGVRILQGSTATVEYVLVRDCGTGVAAAGGSLAQLSHVTIFDVQTGLDARDDALGTGPGLVTADSLIVWQAGLSIAESPGFAVSVTYSDLSGSGVHPGDGNLSADPRFRGPSEGDFRLTYFSPCRGTGKAGTDMGAFPYGSDVSVGTYLRCDSNLDGSNDLADSVHTLLVLFRGLGEGSCPPAADCNGDNLVNVTDAVFQLSYLFRAGARPPAPYPDCSEAPLVDCSGAFCAGR